jgi:hypothetical protein
VFGKSHRIPIDLAGTPQFVQYVIRDHMQEHPESDLMRVLTGEKLCPGSKAAILEFAFVRRDQLLVMAMNDVQYTV